MEPQAVERPDVAKPSGLHSPPDSNNARTLDGSDSELSDLEDDAVAGRFKQEAEAANAPDPAPVVEDIGDVFPDHWSGTVPVFRPNMKQFKDFKLFMQKIDQYGMKSGIVKVIPPQEWKDSLPRLDELVKQIRVREPIKQDIMGSNGTYRQVNILHQRSYNLPQWRQLCDQSEHQPPARRGERRANADKPKPTTRTRAAAVPNQDDEKGEVAASIEADPGVGEEDCDEDQGPVTRRMGGVSRQAKPKTQSTSARRKYMRREGSAMIDETAFKDWDYWMDVSDYTPERCEELERTYWKTLTYAPPLYGADLPGTLFDDDTESWNLNKLPNLLDVLGTKVPGVNTAYLYLGMWKATFAWHLEDVDLYSINFLHFGAPKQWYSISQADARRFEAAMRNIWPQEAKACDQFLRHKAFLISPAALKQQYNITVNKCVSYPGEFVVTYPYGYHSGYNLGYNCAEAVNFALDSWLPMGKIAKRCECAQAQDSVWVDVYEIERKLRGESTEYEETEDDDDEEDDEDEDDGNLMGHPSGIVIRIKGADRKRKRAAHRMCALYVPETYIETVDGKEVVANVASIDKARLDLKCLYCRSKKGACFQCSQKRCARSYHATCAAAAGVFVEDTDVPVFDEDGVEYKEQAFEFSCRFHRLKRDRKLDGDALEQDARIGAAAADLQPGDICQMQFHRGDIFAGIVVENRADEQTVLLNVIPNGDDVEVEWKWLLLPDPSEYRLPKASPNAIPMPTTRQAKQELNAKRVVDELPRKDDVFVDGFTWSEFHSGDKARNPGQCKVDLEKELQLWHYLPKGSTETKPQYTEDPAKPYHNAKSNFLASIPKPMPPPPPPRAPRTAAVSPASYAPLGYPGGKPASMPKSDKPYIYKPRKGGPGPHSMQYTAQQFAPVSRTQAPPPLLMAKAPVPNAVPNAAYRPPTQLGQWPMAPPGQLGQAQLHYPTLPHNSWPPPPPPPPQQLQQQAQAPPRPQHARTTNTPGTIVGPDARLTGPSPTSHRSTDGFAPVGGQYSKPSCSQHAWPSTTTPAGPSAPRLSAIPMTSADLNTSVASPQWQAGGGPASLHQQAISTYQKYRFFQVHHNRDSSRHRTPYAPWGGFTNGYEGNLRAFLLKAQKSLSGGKAHSRGMPHSLPPPTQQRSQVSALPRPVAGSLSNFGHMEASYSPITPSTPHVSPYSTDFTTPTTQHGRLVKQQRLGARVLFATASGVAE
ncbi:hypothetical protein P8C59_006383 [Phyllachora maydis]|uniref:[histone H3]-trimethyl-L-lysine(9) demethylase n=1 Tax=Phyllachora maydis TaxID=1825666 RepID=A0AAD9I675_9PEZI|nr:hypothetical protein P8C59_006383 [Phyllachora maydis]